MHKRTLFLAALVLVLAALLAPIPQAQAGGISTSCFKLLHKTLNFIEDSLFPVKSTLPEYIPDPSITHVDPTLIGQNYHETKYNFKVKSLEPGFGPHDADYIHDPWHQSVNRIYPVNGRFYTSRGMLPEGAFPEKYLDYVMTEKGDFYAAFQHTGSTVIRHSSYLAGAPVAGAGQIKFHGGIPVYVNNNSGHYKPDTVFLKQVLLRLQELGFDLSQIVVNVTPHP
ncbi:MAG: hypothetical protein SGI74_01445 [Oligoflexia bacterium]|nr:hypothetical protein [Oligoflexia bacterium]